jgi:glycosyltransferase involved in cell wall biosynthesis
LLKRSVLEPVVRNAGCLAIGLRNARFYLSMGAHRDQLFWAPYSVDDQAFLTGASSDRSRSGGGPATVVFVGKLLPRKRPLDVVHALDRLGGAARAVFVGDGALRPELESLLATRPWGSLVGFVNQSELPDVFAAADLLVLPSEHEPWGLVVNEGMAAGLVPIVSSAVGCAPDLVSGGAGAVYETGDVDALASAIDGLLDEDRRKAARQEVERRIARYSLVETARGVEAAVHAARERDSWGDTTR